MSGLLHIFLSCDSADKSTADDLKRQLSLVFQPLNVLFWLKEELPPEEYRVKAATFLEKTNLFIAILSMNYEDDGNVRWEAAKAIETQISRPALQIMTFGKFGTYKRIEVLVEAFKLLQHDGQSRPPIELVVAGTDSPNAAGYLDGVRAQYAELGRRIVERLCQVSKRQYSDEKLNGALPRLARATIEDVFAAVGRSEMKAADVVRAMYPDYKEERVTTVPKPDSGWFGLKMGRAVKFKFPGAKDDDDAIPIRGHSGDLPVRFAPDGGAVPGDRIVGIMTPGEEITIYPIQSIALKAFEDAPERWLDVRWDVDEKNPQRFPARIAVQSVNEPGSLAQIAQVIAENDGNIDNIHMSRRSPDFTEMMFDLEVWDLKHLNRLLSQLKENSAVSSAQRVNG